MSSDLEQVISELYERFPLLGHLLFSFDERDIAGQELPTIIALLASMTDEKLAGDTCALLPSTDQISYIVTILVALSAASENFEKRIKEYALAGFDVGDRVRVLPTGHVYEFGGTFSERYGDFFKLNVLGSRNAESRSFAVKEIVRLEKTERKMPKGKGNTTLGSGEYSELDYLIGTECYGNDAVFENEVLLISTQSHFLGFLDRIFISRKDNPGVKIPLKNVITWGVVTPDGDLDFRDSRAASGNPMIAVSSRVEYMANACKRKIINAPRVVVDGVGRFRDSIEAFDDLVDYSKMLVIADHMHLDLIPDLSDRNCTVWNLPLGLTEFVDPASKALEKFNSAYINASNFNIEFHRCSSQGIDYVSNLLLGIGGDIEEEEHLKLIKIMYARFLDIACLVHIDEEITTIIHGSLTDLKRSVLEQRAWIQSEIYAKISEVLEYLFNIISNDKIEFYKEKELELIRLLKSISKNNLIPVIVSDTPISIVSIRKFIEIYGMNVRVCRSKDVNDLSAQSVVVIVGWPRSKNLYRLLNSYGSTTLHAVVYPFENEWIDKAIKKHQADLQRWYTGREKFKEITGLMSSINGLPDVPVGKVNIVGTENLSGFERRLEKVRKGVVHNKTGDDFREAHYVSFYGDGYAWITPRHKIPVLTDLVFSTSVESDVPLKEIRNIDVGDYVLFRRKADRDIIRHIAELIVGNNKYASLRKKATSWKTALRKISSDKFIAHRRLKNFGFSKTEYTVNNWLTDVDLIGPSSIKDLEVIAHASHDSDLNSSIQGVWDSIVEIRKSHLVAGFRLGQTLASQLPTQLEEIGDEETYIELFLDDHSIGEVVIVQIESVNHKTELTPGSIVNQLLIDT